MTYPTTYLGSYPALGNKAWKDKETYLYVLYVYRPETANRTLAEIDELYAAGIPKRRWKRRLPTLHYTTYLCLFI